MEATDKQRLLAQASQQAHAEAAARCGDKLHDLEPPATAGPLVVRPMTLGILRLCESIGIDLGAGAPSTADLAILALCVCGPLDKAAMVALAKQGREAVQAEADLFAFELTMADMAAIQSALNATDNTAPAGGGAEPATKS